MNWKPLLLPAFNIRLKCTCMEQTFGMLCKLFCRGVYMCIALLVVASRIILPIIWTEGIRAVFFPQLAPKPIHNIKRVESLRIMSSATLASSASIGLSKVRSA